MSATVTEHPHGALIIEAGAGTFFVAAVGTERWGLRGYRPGDTVTAGTFLGHYPTRADALHRLAELLEVELLEECADCGALCYWYEAACDYRHAATDAPPCFLIREEVTP